MAHKANLCADVVTNIAFGLAGALLTLFMIWQAAIYAARHSQYLTQNISSTSGPTALEAITPLNLESLPESEQQARLAVTSDEVIAPPPVAILSVRAVGHDVLVQWPVRQTAGTSACTTAAGGGFVMNASDNTRDG